MSRIDALSGGGETGAIKAGEVIDVVPEKAGMGAGAMVGIAVGGIALIGLVVFLIKRKK